MRFLSLALLALLLAAPAAHAQAHFGFGVSVNSAPVAASSGDDFFGVSPLSIYLPITFTSFRIEPEIGLARLSSSVGNNDASITGLHLGTGLFYVAPQQSSTFYAGGRIAAMMTSVDIGDDDDSTTDIMLAPAIGGEYLFGEHFSLGAEAQLALVLLDDQGGDASANALFTRGLLFARWHF